MEEFQKVIDLETANLPLKLTKKRNRTQCIECREYFSRKCPVSPLYPNWPENKGRTYFWCPECLHKNAAHLEGTGVKKDVSSETLVTIAASAPACSKCERFAVCMTLKAQNEQT